MIENYEKLKHSLSKTTNGRYGEDNLKTFAIHQTFGGDIKRAWDMHKIISDLRFEQNLGIIAAEYRKIRSNTHRRKYNHKLFNIIQHDALEEEDNQKLEIV
ncbi:MAG: hypothetical protein KAS61_00390 [Spirochaetes bacterium]|nr:hypothetical protein [Spirochaetota bacterium]